MPTAARSRVPGFAFPISGGDGQAPLHGRAFGLQKNGCRQAWCALRKDTTDWRIDAVLGSPIEEAIRSWS